MMLRFLATTVVAGLALSAQAADRPASQPWQINPPIVKIEKELHRKHPKPGTAALTSDQYIGPGLERMETQALQSVSDVSEKPACRFSKDNGRTWSGFAPLPETQRFINGIEVREHIGSPVYDSRTGMQVRLNLRQIPVKGLWNCFTYVQLSRDMGKTWTTPKPLRYEPGEDFDPDNPLKPGFLQRNQGYYGSNILQHSNGTLVHCLVHTNAKDDPNNDKRAWRMGSVCFIGKWNPDLQDYDWQPGKPISISADISSRGLMEPELAELKDGRVLVIWRGSDTPKTAGRKWYSISTDGGKTLSPVAELKYDDGSRFYSPSSYHRMIRHSVTGKLYWLGNICPTPPRANHPRYPLVIAEVDEDRPALKRSTVTAIDDRKPGQGPQVQFSNFSLLEDREKHLLEIYLTTYGQDPAQTFSADCYKYILTLK